MPVAIHPLAVELNENIRAANPNVYDMLSALGRALYFPKGILSQSDEAKVKAKRLNATIGMATEGGDAMALPCVTGQAPGLPPNGIVRYAPPTGVPDLRQAWKTKQEQDNPSQVGKPMTLPIVTSALTHGLSLVGDLFVNPGDALILPDKIWGNYRLLYEVRLGAKVVQYPFFTPELRFNPDGLRQALAVHGGAGKKVLVILNFPNNPTGYTPTEAEGAALRDALLHAASAGTNVIVVLDDAYFGLGYDDAAMKESLFATLAGAHPRLMAVRLDGATKELFVWGFRVGFITFSVGGVPGGSPLFTALEKKTAGAIRAVVSSSPLISQTIVRNALRAPTFRAEKQQKYEILKARAARLRQALADPSLASVWDMYPFNSGYFMCLRVKGASAEAVRVRLLDAYGVGVIATSDTDIRIAFSCVEEKDMEELVDTLRRAVMDVQGSR